MDAGCAERTWQGAGDDVNTARSEGGKAAAGSSALFWGAFAGPPSARPLFPQQTVQFTHLRGAYDECKFPTLGGGGSGTGAQAKGYRAAGCALKNVRERVAPLACIRRGQQLRGARAGSNQRQRRRGCVGGKTVGVVGGSSHADEGKQGPQGRQATSGLRRPHDRASACGLRRG